MQHCNGCVIVLGEIIERVTGMPYERYVAEFIYKPAGMRNTGLPQQDGLEANIDMGYTKQDKGLRSNVLLHGAAGSAAGGGYSTAEDLLAFVNLELAKQTRKAGPARLTQAKGGAPGVGTAVQTDGTWTVIVLTNLDPPTATAVSSGIFDRLAP